MILLHEYPHLQTKRWIDKNRL